MKLPRNCQIWLPGYLKGWTRARRRAMPRRVWLALTDHFEPFWRNTDEGLASQRAALWSREWPHVASKFADSAGRPPVYTFFYPEEEYRPRILEELARMTRAGIADVEVHLHHDNEGEQNFVDRMSGFMETLMSRHGLLRQVDGRPAFGFIHGNWALDNSLPDGSKCGLNNELTLLKKLGCYADFTLPSVPNATQTRMVNRIYWAVDDPARPKSHDTGMPVEDWPAEPEGALMIIPGPLGVRSRLLGSGERIVPRIERGEVAGADLPSASRIRLWAEVAPRIGDDCFVKLYTHGTQERNSGPLLSGGLAALFGGMLDWARREGREVYFVSAWQMRQAIDALRTGCDPVSALAGASGNRVRVPAPRH